MCRYLPEPLLQVRGVCPGGGQLGPVAGPCFPLQKAATLTPTAAAPRGVPAGRAGLAPPAPSPALAASCLQRPREQGVGPRWGWGLRFPNELRAEHLLCLLGIHTSSLEKPLFRRFARLGAGTRASPSRPCAPGSDARCPRAWGHPPLRVKSFTRHSVPCS